MIDEERSAFLTYAAEETLTVANELMRLTEEERAFYLEKLASRADSVSKRSELALLGLVACQAWGMSFLEEARRLAS